MSSIMSEQMLNVEFVQEVEKHPCLYNNRLKEYARKDLTEKAWYKVGQKFNITGSQCKEKWKNLRTVFCRNFRPPNSTLGRKKKPYYLSEAMKFALPFIRSQYIPSVYRYQVVESNLPSECIEVGNVDQEDQSNQDPTQEIKLENDVLSVTSSPSHPPSSPSCTTPIPSPQITIMQPSSPPSYSLNTPPRLVPTKRSHDSIDMYDRDEDNNHRRSLERSESTMDDIKNSKKRFLLSLLPDVYAMNNEQMRSFRIKVLNLIEEFIQTPEQWDIK